MGLSSNAGYQRVPPGAGQSPIVGETLPDEFFPMPNGADAIAPSADATGATDRAALETALNAGRSLYLLPGGVYTIDRRVDVTSENPGQLLCLGAMVSSNPVNVAHIVRGSAFVPSASGDADNPENAFLKYVSTLAGVDATTLSASIRRGRTSFSTTASLSSPVGKTYRLRSIGTASGGLGGLDTDVTVDELVTVASGSGPYVADRGLGATHGANVDASNTTQVREVTTVVRSPVISGVRFHSSTTVGGAATQIACAVFLEYVTGAEIDIQHFGFSRTAVEMRGSRDCRVRAENMGNSNGSVWERSCQESRIEVQRRQRGAARFHASGIPRAELYVDYLSAGGKYVGDVAGGVVGAEFVGYIDAKVDRFYATDMDCTQRVTADATRLPDLNGSQALGAGISIRAIQTGTTFDETPVGMVMDDVHLSQCGGPATDGQQGAFYAVNVQGLRVNSLCIENKGGDGTVAAPYRAGGALFHDCYSAQIESMQTSGVENALGLIGSWNRFHIGTWRWDGTNAHTNMQIAMRWGMVGDGVSQPISVTIGRMVCADTPTYIVANMNGVTVEDRSRDGLEIGELIVENKTAKGANYGRVKWFVGANSYTPATGEIAEIMPPFSCTFDNTTDVFTVGGGHQLANGTPVYVRGTANPNGFTAGTIYWVIGRTGTTFQLAATKGGAAITASSTNGTAVEVATAIPAIRQPVGPAAARRHVAVVNGSSFGSGPLPAGYYLCSVGPLCMVRTDDPAMPGDTIEAATGTGLGNVNAAASDPFAIVLGAKPTGTNVVQCRRAVA